MTVKQMMLDATFFLRLCSILQPENILCLGKNTFECVYRAIQGEDIKMSDGFSKSYNDFLDNHDPIKVQFAVEGEVCFSRIFPLAHCGALGTANRSLEKQKKDWEKILE